MERDLHKDYHDLLFGVRRSVRYHSRRRGFFEAVHAVVVFVALLFGSATLATFGAAFGETLPLWVKLIPAALTTVLSAADLVIGCMRRAWQHAELARQFIELERTLERNRAAPTAALITETRDRRLAIEVTEPPVLRILDTLCHNELLRAMGYPSEQQVPVGFWQRLFAQFFDFQQHRLHGA